MIKKETFSNRNSLVDQGRAFLFTFYLEEHRIKDVRIHKVGWATKYILFPLSQIFSWCKPSCFEDPRKEYLTVTSCKKFMKSFNQKLNKQEYVEIEDEVETNVELIKLESNLNDISIFDNQNFEDYDYEYMFKYREDTYVYDKKTNNYKLLCFDVKQSFSSLKKRSCGLNKEEHKKLKKIFGSCTMEISTAPWYIIMFKDSVNFYYLFQIFSLTVWYIDGSYKYATLIVIMIAYSIFGELVDIRENLNRLKRMAHYECPLNVRRIDENGNSYFKEIMSGDLVPGDVFILPEKSTLPCDAILLSGEAIINEAMLTGESTASNKVEINKSENKTISDFNILNSSQIQHFLFSGTTALKCCNSTESDTLALVVNTGFSSIKGSLIKSILYPAPERFKFHTEIKIYMCVLFVLCSCLIGTVLPTMIKYFDLKDILICSCDALLLYKYSPSTPGGDILLTFF